MADLYGKIPISPEPRKAEPAQPDQRSGPRDADPKPPPEKKRLKKRYILIPLGILLLIGSVLFSSVFFVPALLKKKLPSLFLEKTGLNLAIEKAEFNPLKCALQLNGITIESKEKKDPGSHILSINDVFIDLDFTSLLRNGIVASRLEIDSAELTILRYDNNTYNISQLFAKYRTNPSDIMDFAELPFLYSLNNISVDNSTVIFNDLSTGKIHKVENLKVSLPTLSNFSFDANKYIQPRFSAVINGSPIELVSEASFSADQQQDGASTRLTCKLQSIDIPLYAKYLPLPFPVDIEKGKADGTVQISFYSKEDKAAHLSLDYQFQTNDLIITSHDKALKLEAPLLNIEGSLFPLTSAISLKNLVMRDPTLTINNSITAATIDSLFLKDAKQNSQMGVPLQLPSLTVALFIADNGKILYKANEKDQVFRSVQLSMRNFRNALAAGKNDSTIENSFRITGESDNDFSTFSWQGSFTNQIPQGNLEINNLHISRLLHFLDLQTDSASEGSVDIRGKLSLLRSDTAPLSPIFEDGNLVASSVMLKEKGEEWLNSPAVKIAPLSLEADRTNLGNILIESSTIKINQNALPAIVDAYVHKDSHVLQGLDVKGKLIVVPEKKGNPLLLDDVHLQISDLEKKDLNTTNFAFSAATGQAGSLQAKGRISVSPLDGDIELAFAELPLQSVLPWFLSSSGYTVEAATRIGGKGDFSIKDSLFEGSLELTQGNITDVATTSRYSFDNAAFGNLSFTNAFKRIKGSKILFKNLAVNSKDLELASDSATISSLERDNNSMQIGDVALVGGKARTSAKVPPLLKPIIEEASSGFALNSFSMLGNLAITGNEPPSDIVLQDMQLSIQNLGTTLPKKDNISLQARIGEQGKILANGLISVSPLQTRLSLQPTDLQTSVLDPFQLQPKNYRVSAVMNGSIAYHYPENLYSGSLELTDGILANASGETLCRWQKSVLKDFTFTKQPFHIGISVVDIDAPQLDFSRNSSQKDIFAVLQQKINAIFKSAEKSDGAVSFSQVTIPQIQIHNGIVNFSDERLVPPWKTEISSIQASITDFHVSDSADPTQFHFTAQVQGSPVQIEGNIVPQTEQPTADMSLSLSRFPLFSLKEQLTNQLKIDPDNATIDLRYTRNDSKDAESNRADLRVSSLRPLTTTGQTAFTLALLNEKDTIFSESILLQKNEKPLFTQVVNHFQKLIVKSGISPYLVLKPPFDALKNETHIDFAPGEFLLDDTLRQRVAQFALLLKAHPLIRLTMSATVDTKDTTALRHELEKRELERVQQQNEILLDQWKQRQIKTGSAEAKPQADILVKDIPAAELEAFTPLTPKAVVVEKHHLNTLGRKRLEQIREYLITTEKIAERNISLTDIHIVKSPTAAAPGVDITLDYIAQD